METPNIAKLRELHAKVHQSPWTHNSYQSGTESVLVRQWVGPKSKQYGSGHICLTIGVHAYNIDYHPEHEIEQEKWHLGQWVAGSHNIMESVFAEIDALKAALSKPTTNEAKGE